MAAFPRTHKEEAGAQLDWLRASLCESARYEARAWLPGCTGSPQRNL